jgi:FkbM family methyltransferase
MNKNTIDDGFWTLTISGNLKVCTHSDIQLMTPFILLEQEDWFEMELLFLCAVVEPGMGVLDIGANHGVYSLRLAKRLQGQGRVVALEPASSPAEMLERSITENSLGGVLSLMRVGLSDREGEAKLYIGANSELNSLNAVDGFAHEASENVRLTTLDSLLTSANWPQEFQIDVLKLDAEGEEIRILNGGRRFFLEQDPLVLFEWKHGNAPNIGLLEAFSDLGYGLYRLIPGLQALVPVLVGDALDDYQLNLFACKPTCAKRLYDANRLLTANDLNTLTQSPVISWVDEMSNYPFVSALRTDGQALRNWQELDRTNDPQWDIYQKALDAYLSAINSTQPLQARWTWLNLSLAHLETLIRIGDTNLETTLLQIRVLDAAGQRANAVKLNYQLVELIQNDLTVSLERPFIPPLADYDHRLPQGGIGAWLQAAIIEGLEVRRAYSSYFHRDDRLLRLLDGNPNRSLSMDRRRALLALTAGQHVKISNDSPLLGSESSDHRNSEWWHRLA